MFWVRSYWVEDWVSYQPRDATAPIPWKKEYSLHSSGGGVILVWWTHRYPLPEAMKSVRQELSDTPTSQWRRSAAGGYPLYSDAESPLWQKCGFYWMYLDDAAASRKGINGIVPYYALALVFAAWPSFAFARWLRARRRVGRRLCPACGYDLRATPDRCPECGVVPETQPGAAA